MRSHRRRLRLWSVVGLVGVVVLTGGGIATAATLLLTSKSLTTGGSSVSIPKFSTSLAPSPSPGTATAGGALSDVAALSGATTTATGTISYKLYGPGDTSCTGSPVATPTAQVTGTNSSPANRSYTPAAAPTPTPTGTYRWTVSYSGDSRNQLAPSPSATCGNGGSVVVTPAYQVAIGTISANTSSGNGTIQGTASGGTPVRLLICSGTATSCTGALGTPTTVTVSGGNWSYDYNGAKNTQYTVTATLGTASASKTWNTGNAST